MLANLKKFDLFKLMQVDSEMQIHKLDVIMSTRTDSIPRMRLVTQNYEKTQSQSLLFLSLSRCCDICLLQYKKRARKSTILEANVPSNFL